MFNMDWVRLDLKNGELDGTKIATQDYLNENWNEVESYYPVQPRSLNI